jgi:hypothetical protein
MVARFKLNHSFIALSQVIKHKGHSPLVNELIATVTGVGQLHTPVRSTITPKTKITKAGWSFSSETKGRDSLIGADARVGSSPQIEARKCAAVQAGSSSSTLKARLLRPSFRANAIGPPQAHQELFVATAKAHPLISGQIDNGRFIFTPELCIGGPVRNKKEMDEHRKQKNPVSLPEPSFLRVL